MRKCIGIALLLSGPVGWMLFIAWGLLLAGAADDKMTERFFDAQV